MSVKKFVNFESYGCQQTARYTMHFKSYNFTDCYHQFGQIVQAFFFNGLVYVLLLEESDVEIGRSDAIDVREQINFKPKAKYDK